MPNEDLEQTALGVSARWPDADIKLWVVVRALALRRDLPDVFSYGEYMPVAAAGPAAEHVVSFARRCEEHVAVVVVPRQFQRLRGNQPRGNHGTPRANWGGSQLILPDVDGRTWRCRDFRAGL